MVESVNYLVVFWSRVAGPPFVTCSPNDPYGRGDTPERRQISRPTDLHGRGSGRPICSATKTPGVHGRSSHAGADWPAGAKFGAHVTDPTRRKIEVRSPIHLGQLKVRTSGARTAEDRRERSQGTVMLLLVVKQAGSGWGGVLGRCSA